MKNIVHDFRQALPKLLKPSHENKWVAIAPDYSRVIAAADTLRELLQSAKDPNAIFFKVLPHDLSFAPLFFGA
jgi:predicted RNase H-like HicB family nuclease